MATAIKMDLRKDLLQTSTGVGHHFRPGFYFPSSNFKVCRIIQQKKPAFFLQNKLIIILRIGSTLPAVPPTASCWQCCKRLSDKTRYRSKYRKPRLP